LLQNIFAIAVRSEIVARPAVLGFLFAMVRKTSRTCFVLVLLAFFCGLSSPAQHAPSQDAQSLIMQGQKALAEKQYTTAEQDFTRLLQLGVRTAPVYSNLGVVYMRVGKIDKAITMLDKARNLAPTVPGIRLNLGLAYLREQEFKLASRSFAEVISLDPNDLQAQYLKGMCDFMTDDFQAAVDSLQPIFDQEQTDLEYLFMLGISYGMLKRDEDSQRTFAHLVEVGGDTPHLHLLLGKAYLALGQLSEADKELQQATKGEPLPYAHYYRGILAQKQGKTDEATAQFSEEVALIPNNPWAYKELATIQMDRDENAKAIQLLERGVKNNPESADLYATLGRAYLHAPDTKRAVAMLKKAIALDPKSGMYHYQLAQAYLAEGHRQQAEVEKQQARKLMSGDSQGKMEQFSRGSGSPTPDGNERKRIID